MYNKNLTEDFRLRLSTKDMDFLRALSEERAQSVSEVLRSIIGEYRRGIEQIKTLNDALTLLKDPTLIERLGDVHGDTETYFNNQL